MVNFKDLFFSFYITACEAIYVYIILALLWINNWWWNRIQIKKTIILTIALGHTLRWPSFILHTSHGIFCFWVVPFITSKCNRASDLEIAVLNLKRPVLEARKPFWSFTAFSWKCNGVVDLIDRRRLLSYWIYNVPSQLTRALILLESFFIPIH